MTDSHNHKEKVYQVNSLSPLFNDNFLKILESITAPSVKELLISKDELKAIREELGLYFISREKKRYARLEEAESSRQKRVHELETIEFEIASNDAWFIAVKKGEEVETSDSYKVHIRKAEELYSKKRTLIDESLVDADKKIKDVINKIEKEEDREPLIQSKQLGSLLQPFEEKRKQIIADQIHVQERQKSEEEARQIEGLRARQKKLRAEAMERNHNQMKELINKWRTEDLEKKRIDRMKRERDIRACVDNRKIPFLIHFTPISNVESILANGLRSRNSLKGQEFIFTDERRCDGWLDWVSTSISFPNYKMFYTKRNSLKDVDGWAVLLIDPEVLWELDCKYILTNAASTGIRVFNDSRWSSVKAFEEMFGHVEHRNGIPEYYTTDPQAEVMIQTEIPPCYINVIVVENRDEKEKLINLKNIVVSVFADFFTSRDDFNHWRDFRLSPFPNKK